MMAKDFEARSEYQSLQRPGQTYSRCNGQYSRSGARGQPQSALLMGQRRAVLSLSKGREGGQALAQQSRSQQLNRRAGEIAADLFAKHEKMAAAALYASERAELVALAGAFKSFAEAASAAGGAQ